MSSLALDSERKIYHDSFAAKIRRFMVENAAAFNTLTEKEHEPPGHGHVMDDSDYFCGDPIPLEYVMQVPIAKRKKQLLQLISPGDVIQGHVTLKTPLALGVQIMSLVSSRKVREISQLDVQGLVPRENLASEKSKCDKIFEEMEIDDVVRAVIVDVQDSDLQLSFSSEHLSPSPLHTKGIHLGFIEGKRIASIKKRPKSLSVLVDELEDDPGFTNPSSAGNLKGFLGVAGYDSEIKPTLIEAVQKAHFPKSDYSHALRKVQRHNWSMDTVAVGVRHFKNSEFDQAMKLFDHALDIDPCNVEGRVARGALLANKCKFTKAIAEFEAALTINHTHKNARRYLVETQIAYGKKLEEQGNLEGAVVCYREALADDASQIAIKTRLDALVSILEKKAAEKLEKQQRDTAERNRMKKLRSSIKDEKKKKKKKGKMNKTKKSGKRSISKRSQKKKDSKHHRRHYSSDEEDSSRTDTSSSSYYSPSCSRSPSSPPPPPSSSNQPSSLHRRQLHNTRPTSSCSPPPPPPPPPPGPKDTAARKHSRSRSSSSYVSQDSTTRKSRRGKRGRYYSRSRSRSKARSRSRSKVRLKSRSYTPPSRGKRKDSTSRSRFVAPRSKGERKHSSKRRNTRSLSHSPEG